MIALASFDYQMPLGVNSQIQQWRIRSGDDFEMANCNPSLISKAFDRLKSDPASFKISDKLRAAGFSEEEINEYLWEGDKN